MSFLFSIRISLAFVNLDGILKSIVALLTAEQCCNVDTNPILKFGAARLSWSTVKRNYFC